MDKTSVMKLQNVVRIKLLKTKYLILCKHYFGLDNEWIPAAVDYP